MSKNITPIILIVLAIGVYFTYTTKKIDELKVIKLVNAGYEQAIANSEKLIKVRDNVLKSYNNISPEDRMRLDKMLPNNIDNVRLIIDTNGVASRHSLFLKGIKTSATVISDANKTIVSQSQNNVSIPRGYDTVTVSFNVTTNYQTFVDFIKDLQASLRIMDITKITLKVNENGTYDFGVEFKTYWLKQ
ncbi:MAG: hypothetical protein AAB637_01440 [Patescibacteria group bacterium]|mgnify:CR=1 FL=1